jgi:hypothetical protein
VHFKGYLLDSLRANVDARLKAKKSLLPDLFSLWYKRGIALCIDTDLASLEVVPRGSGKLSSTEVNGLTYSFEVGTIEGITYPDTHLCATFAFLEADEHLSPSVLDDGQAPNKGGHRVSP